MKKITKLLTILLTGFTLTGCNSKQTIKEKRTIVIDVDTDVIPKFSSNFGVGNYDPSTKKYTHTIDYIKDLYIFLSYEDLKTETVYIPTSEMNKETINKQVEFGELLDAEIEITVDGVKTLEGLQIDNSLEYTNLKIGNKNTFKFTLPTRENDYNVKFTLPDYKEFNINLNKEKLVSGSTKISAIAITENQVSIGIEGSGYNYKVYSATTNKLVTSGNNYYSDKDIEYIILANDTGYYIEIEGKETFLCKVNKNENTIINAGSNSYNNYGYLQVEGKDQPWLGAILYDKVNKKLINSTELKNTLDSLGLLIRKNENEWYYLENLEEKVTGNEDEWSKKYEINYDDFVKVRFDTTIYHTYTNNILSSGIKDSVEINYDIENVEFENNVFKYTTSEINDGNVEISLYTKENEFIDTITKYINKKYKGEIFSGTITYNGRKVPYNFPVFGENLVYEDNKYTYENQKINVDVSYVSFQIFNAEYGYINYIYGTDSAYILDEDLNVILGTNIDNKLYFELHAGETYTLNYNNEKYEFTLTENHINNGNVLIIPDDTKKVNVKIPNGYSLSSNDYPEIKLTPDNDGVVRIPVGKSSQNNTLRVNVSNGFVTLSCEIIIDGSELYELKPFYTLGQGGYIYSEYLNYSYGTNETSYYYIDSNKYGDEFDTSYEIIYEDHAEQIRVNLNDFMYNETYKAYYYDIKSTFDYVVTIDDSIELWQIVLNGYYGYGDYYYMNENSSIKYNGNTYNLSDYNDKYLTIQVDGNGGLIINPSSNS